jgi:hypothetical protein
MYKIPIYISSELLLILEVTSSTLGKTKPHSLQMRFKHLPKSPRNNTDAFISMTLKYSHTSAA